MIQVVVGFGGIEDAEQKPHGFVGEFLVPSQAMEIGHFVQVLMRQVRGRLADHIGDLQGRLEIFQGRVVLLQIEPADAAAYQDGRDLDAVLASCWRKTSKTWS
ncbi:MAG: hypothetical protein U0800_06060 [Isosphaeraceae bacterium]